MKISTKSVRVKLDRIDRNIIRHLQANGRIQNNDLAREIGLSPSSCLRRVKLLEDAGVIQNYTTIVDQQKIGFQLILFLLTFDLFFPKIFSKLYFFIFEKM